MDPLTLALIGAGLTGGSSILNFGAQDAVNAARNAVISAERQRQLGFDQEAHGVTNQSLGRFSNFGTQQADDASRLAALFKTPVVTPNTANTTVPLPAASTDQVQREIDNKTGIAKAYVNNQADKLAALRSFGDVMGGLNRGLVQDTQKVGQIGNFKRGSTAAEQIELDNANRAGNTQRFWGDITGGLGKVALTAGLGGTFAPAAAPGVASTGAIIGAAGPTSVNGAPLVGNVFSTGASPFLTYGYGR